MAADSMNIGVAGMDAYQAQIDVISNNIANVGTTGYKDQNVNFQDLLYQTQQTASGATQSNGGTNAQQVGIGVKIGSISNNLTQGGVQTTGVNTNMMVNGDGYFILGNLDGSGAPKYTRDGNFSLNSNGTLYDPSSGLAVLGYQADASGNVAATGNPQPLQIPIGLKSEAIATGSGLKTGPTGDKVFDMSFGGNLDSTQYASAVSNGAVSAANLTTAGTTIYDSLGNPHLVQITFQPQLASTGLAPMPFKVDNTAGSAVTAATEWSYTLTSTDGTTFGNGSTTSSVQYAFFDAGGNFINTSGTVAPAVGGTLAGTTVHEAGNDPSAATGDQMTITKWGIVAGADNSGTTATAVPGPIGIDLSAMTANGSAAQPLSTYQNGVAPGILSNVSVGQDGTLTGSFTNGQSLTLGRVTLARFQNEEGLVHVGSNQFETSAASGQALVGTPNLGSFGAIQGDALEMSNVSIADEFTKLITAQNAFTANSKSITTANENLQTVIGLIH